MRFPLALALASTALAQTFTDCNPLEKKCPDSKGLNAASYSIDFSTASGNTLPEGWKAADGTTMSFSDQGAEFIINKKGQAPTIETNFYIFYGIITVTLKSAPGPGIISSIVLESDDLDEIDWEFFGSGQYQPTAQTNFFGKGNTTSYDRATFHPVQPIPQAAFHTYVIDWSPERIVFSIDGTVVRTLNANDPLTNGRNNYPQTPCQLKLGNWAGGFEGAPPGTIQWAGGKTTYEGVPYTMYVKKVDIVNTNPATSYVWTDKSGSDASIKVVRDGSSSGNDDTPKPKPSTTADAGSPSGTSTTSKTRAAPLFPTEQPGPEDSGFGLVGTGATKHQKAPAATGGASVPGNGTVTTSTTADGTTPTGPSSSDPVQQEENAAAGRAGLDRLTLAGVGVFTLSMCFWML